MSTQLNDAPRAKPSRRGGDEVQAKQPGGSESPEQPRELSEQGPSAERQQMADDAGFTVSLDDWFKS